MLKDSIYAAQMALRLGIEISEESLAEFDQRPGREHRRNRLIAERMEQDIAQMKKALIGIEKPNGTFPSGNETL